MGHLRLSGGGSLWPVGVRHWCYSPWMLAGSPFARPARPVADAPLAALSDGEELAKAWLLLLLAQAPLAAAASVPAADLAREAPELCARDGRGARVGRRARPPAARRRPHGARRAGRSARRRRRSRGRRRRGQRAARRALVGGHGRARATRPRAGGAARRAAVARRRRRRRGRARAGRGAARSRSFGRRSPPRHRLAGGRPSGRRPARIREQDRPRVPIRSGLAGGGPARVFRRVALSRRARELAPSSRPARSRPRKPERRTGRGRGAATRPRPDSPATTLAIGERPADAPRSRSCRPTCSRR